MYHLRYLLRPFFSSALDVSFFKLQYFVNDIVSGLSLRRGVIVVVGNVVPPSCCVKIASLLGLYGSEWIVCNHSSGQAISKQSAPQRSRLQVESL